jgi:hypothetical protein
MIMKTGALTISTSAAQNFTLGFIPSKIEVYNTTSKDQLVWTEDMPDGYGLKRVAGGTQTYITTGGITPLGDDESLTITASDTTVDGNTTTFTCVRGFTLGTDTDINVCGEQLVYVAFGLGQDGD